MMFIRVVLPEPEWPIMAINSPDEMVSVRECRECSTKLAEELFQADRPEGGCWRRVGFLGLKDDIGRGVPTSRDEVLRRD